MARLCGPALKSRSTPARPGMNGAAPHCLYAGCVAQRREVIAAPGARGIAVVDDLVDDALLLRMLLHRHREPARLAVDADLAAVLVVAALELHMVEHDEKIGLRHAMQISEPG